MKKTFLTALLVSAFAASAFAVPAMAEEGKMREWGEKYFEKIDTNGDKSISKDEHTAFSDSKFREADKNGDGVISHEEFLEKKQEHKEKFKDMKNKADGE